MSRWRVDPTESLLVEASTAAAAPPPRSRSTDVYRGLSWASSIRYQPFHSVHWQMLQVARANHKGRPALRGGGLERRPRCTLWPPGLLLLAEEVGNVWWPPTKMYVGMYVCVSNPGRPVAPASVFSCGAFFFVRLTWQLMSSNKYLLRRIHILCPGQLARRSRLNCVLSPSGRRDESRRSRAGQAGLLATISHIYLRCFPASSRTRQRG